MDKIEKEIRRKIFLETEPYDLVILCSKNKMLNKDICESKDFWFEKLKIDYPYKVTSLANAKKTYIESFTYVSRKIEQFIPIFMDFCFPGQEYANPEDKKRLYKALYKSYIEALKTLDEFQKPESIQEVLDNGESPEIYRDVFDDAFYDTVEPFIPINLQEIPDMESGQRYHNLLDLWYYNLIEPIFKEKMLLPNLQQLMSKVGK